MIMMLLLMMIMMVMIINQTSEFANPVFSFYTFYVVAQAKSHLPYGQRNVLYS